MKFNLSEKMNELLSLNRFGKGQDNEEIYDLLQEFINRVKKDADLDKIDRDIVNELAGEKFK